MGNQQTGSSPGEFPPPIVHRMKYCESCTLFRPRKSAHCNQCGNCIAGFDHHCTWLGTCVGRRNYREFLLFVFFIMLCSVYCSAMSCLCLVLNYFNRSRWGNQGGDMKVLPALFDVSGVISLLLIPYCLVTFWFTFVLFVFHLNLIRVNQSTNERLKSKETELEYYWIFD